MSRYFISYACGHTVLTHVEGLRRKDKDRKVAWLETRSCVDCFKKEKDDQRINAGKAFAVANGLPLELEGAPKQVQWAQEIRATRFQELQEVVQAGRQEMSDSWPLAAKEALKRLEDALERRRAWVQAIEWIDSRDTSIHDISRGAAV